MNTKVAERIWARDASLWKTDDASVKIINNSLGWLTVADEMLGVAGELGEFANSIRVRGFQHVMVCGMGGSSLCPEVLARTFGRQAGFPELLVLDSTDAEAWLVLGAAEMASGKHREARATFTACTKLATRGPRHECAQMLQ